MSHTLTHATHIENLLKCKVVLFPILLTCEVAMADERTLMSMPDGSYLILDEMSLFERNKING